MAQVKLRLNVNKFGYVRQSHPTTWYDLTGQTYVNLYTGGDLLYFSFASFPSSLKRKRLYFANAKFHVVAGYQASAIFNILAAADTFTPSTITYATKPDGAVPGYALSSPNMYSGGGDQLFEPVVATTTEAKSIQAKLMALKHTAYMSCSSSEAGEVYFRKLSDGTTVPWVEIAYDDSVDVLSQISAGSYPSGNSVDPRVAQSFTWDYGPAGDYHCFSETWTQASAKLFWRKSGASTWNQISISGSTKNTSVPAYTFPSGSTIQWYLQGTDTEGTTSSTSAKTFTTAASQITMETYPTGNTVDNRSALTFSWHFASSVGNFAQKNAKLYWKVSGAASWNQISDANTTPIMTVPGYTFPAGKQIVWYMEGTDESGGVSSTSDSPGSFTTQGYTLAMTSFPSGSNVTTKDATVFSWTLSNSFGAATQTSAKLYWRVSGGST